MNDALYDVREAEFSGLIHPNAKLMALSTGHMWTEGPVWVPGHQCLYFSDIPNQRIMRWTPDGHVTTFRENSDFANGNAIDREGRLVSCQHGTRSVTRTEHDGTISTLADSYDGKPLNSPNDLVVKSDGSVWFTDPTYGIMGDYEGNRAISEQSARHVFRLDSLDSKPQPVVSDFIQPNGLAFSPDEMTIYIADSGRSHDPSARAVVKAYDVVDGCELVNGRDFAEIAPGVPDGLRTDMHGNVWISSKDSVQCFAPDGMLLGRILIPEVVSNLAFGGPRNTHLFLTATTSVYAVHVNVAGAHLGERAVRSGSRPSSILDEVDGVPHMPGRQKASLRGASA